MVGTHLDQVPVRERDRRCQIWRDQLEKYRIGCQGRRHFPHIVQVHFVGCPPSPKGHRAGINIEALNNAIHAAAFSMESPKSMLYVKFLLVVMSLDTGWLGSSDAFFLAGFKVKVLEEKIPASYETLRDFIESLRRRSATSSHPAIHKQNF